MGMALGWRKKKAARISNFARGSSLVVQTGFPTSLIHLFLNNNNTRRFHHKPTQSPPPFHQPLPPTDNHHPHEPPSAGCININTNTNTGGSGSNKAIGAVFNMLLMLLLPLATFSVHRLTLGITISAFLLLFLEFAATHLLSSFHYFSQSLSACPSLLNFLSLLLKTHTFCTPSLLSHNIQRSPASHHIETVEINTPPAPQNSKGISSEITLHKAPSKRGGTLKSKIATKLRGLRRKKRTKDRQEIEKLSKEEESELSNSAVPSSVEGDDSSPISEIQQENWTKLDCIEDIEVDVGITGSHQEVEEGSESNVQKDGQEHERIGRGGSSVSGALMLFIVALSGLVMGRFPAFLLALTWMFMLNILIPPTTSLTVHFIKCCQHISS